MTNEEAAEFRDLVEKGTGHLVDEQEAPNRAIKLCALCRMLLDPILEDPKE